MNMKKRQVLSIAAAIIGLLVLSCSSTKEGDPGLEGEGTEFSAHSMLMTAGEDWGKAVEIADFNPGIVFEGVESIEAEVVYGETTVSWIFSGFEAHQALTSRFLLNLDLFQSDAFFSVSYLPGRYSADAGIWPREEMKETIGHKWIDSIGRFAGSTFPDATEGWEEILYEGHADENGDFSVLMLFNHYTESPPVVYWNFTNPEVTATISVDD